MRGQNFNFQATVFVNYHIHLKIMAQPKNTSQPQYIAPISPFQIEGFYLTRLNIGFIPPNVPGESATQYRSGFDFRMADHNSQANRFKLRLKFTIDELSESGNPIGRSVDSEIVGFFYLDPPEEEEKMRARVLLNGISTLYGMLRGFVAMATGCFPGTNPLLIPCQMPQDIVALVESNRKKGSVKTTGSLDRNSKPETASKRETIISSI
jgi:hypothetical protein